jgi:hypothetical protein
MTGSLQVALRSIVELSFFSLTCNLILPKQSAKGVVSISIRPENQLAVGDTDVSGSTIYPEEFNVYVSLPTIPHS